MPSYETRSILSIDTSTPRGSVALLRGRDVVAELRFFSPKTHSERLLSSVEFIMKTAGWHLRDLNLISVCIGPGSFTGIRIGVSTALGLAQSLSIPFAGISGLDALAHEVAYCHEVAQGGAGHKNRPQIGIALDAQRSQVYYAKYIVSKRGVRRAGRPGLWFPEDLGCEIGNKRLYLAGDGAVRYARELRISASGKRRLILMDLFLAAGVARLALAQRRSWRCGEFLRAEPLYIRPLDALRSGKPPR